MVTPTCSKCRRVIPSDCIRVANDVAYCRACNVSYRLSELTHDEDREGGLDLHRPPPGAWFRNDRGGTVIGASHRSLGTGAGLLFIALFWNGIVSIFVLLAVAATLHHLHFPVPEWFPAPNLNKAPMSVGMTLFLWLFLTPFISIGLFLAGSALSSLFGRTEVRLLNSRGTVFTGLGVLGWTRRFDAAQVKTVRLHQQFNREGRDRYAIVAETREGKEIKFGSLLPPERRQFVLAALRQTLLR